MPEITSCPQCQRKLRVPDDLIGRAVKCPGCGLQFTAAIDPPAAPRFPYGAVEEEPAAGRRSPPPLPPPRPVRDDDYDRGQGREDDYDRPRRRPGLAVRQEWISVRVGLTLLIVSLIIGVVSAIIFGVGVVISISAQTMPPPAMGNRGFPSRGGDTEVFAGLTILCSLVFLLAWRIVSIVGYCFFLSAPARTESSGLAGGALGLGIAWPILLLLGVLLAAAVARSAATSVMLDPGGAGFFSRVDAAGILLIATMAITGLLFVSELACTLLFYRNVCRTLRSDGLARGATVQLILGGVLVLWIVAQAVATFIILRMALSGSLSLGTADSFGTVANICSILWLVLEVGWWIWYIVTTVLVRNVVSEHLERDR
jgi:hypothetical protein